ncbi:hypothetical protein BB560_001432 [Smittium megazygosporum]|uniref:cAMP-dependent protein kinase n=1 Tax=Smittium megazygosporum TaxID=133381 RepID=A0A2T9ZHJ2_9FUNG|nr:hypothetical protein BB560_001432 [Smittium megazygosporum]
MPTIKKIIEATKNREKRENEFYINETEAGEFGNITTPNLKLDRANLVLSPVDTMSPGNMRERVSEETMISPKNLASLNEMSTSQSNQFIPSYNDNMKQGMGGNNFSPHKTQGNIEGNDGFLLSSLPTSQKHKIMSSELEITGPGSTNSNASSKKSRDVSMSERSSSEESSKLGSQKSTDTLNLNAQVLQINESTENTGYGKLKRDYGSKNRTDAEFNELHEQIEGNNVGKLLQAEDEFLNFRKIVNPVLNIGDYEFSRTIGTGSFGRVRIARNPKSNQYYAVKILRKAEVVRARQVEHVNNERAVLAFCDSNFIVKLKGTCQDSINLYMFLEYIVGGELFSYLRKYKRFPSSVAKFYAAEVTLAFEYLHNFNIVYRDLKPENILIDANGHIKLTDMGFAKHVPATTWTLCGTPDYLAPEIIKAKGYGKAVDWYSLGILIFEMIAGYPPFYHKDHYILYERILGGRIHWPPKFDPLARHLVQKLTEHDLTRRFGNLKSGANDIKSHIWFQEVPWDKLERQEIAAPLVPAKRFVGDTGNFDRYPESYDDFGNNTAGDIFRSRFINF